MRTDHSSGAGYHAQAPILASADEHNGDEAGASYLQFFAGTVRDTHRPGYAWIAAATKWEERRRWGNVPGDFPVHGIAAQDLGDAAGHLWAYAARIRAHPDGANLGGIAAVLDAAVLELTAEMERGANPLQ